MLIQNLTYMQNIKDVKSVTKETVKIKMYQNGKNKYFTSLSDEWKSQKEQILDVNVSN